MIDNCGEGMEGGSVTIAATEGQDLILFLGSWVLRGLVSADVGALFDSHSVENVEQVVDEGVQVVVAVEIEVIGVDASGANEVI